MGRKNPEEKHEKGEALPYLNFGSSSSAAAAAACTFNANTENFQVLSLFWLRSLLLFYQIALDVHMLEKQITMPSYTVLLLNY